MVEGWWKTDFDTRACTRGGFPKWWRWWRFGGGLMEVWWRVVEMVEMVEHGGGSAVTPPHQNETDRFPNSNFEQDRFKTVSRR